jgi:hypothetical protein
VPKLWRRCATTWMMMPFLRLYWHRVSFLAIWIRFWAPCFRRW